MPIKVLVTDDSAFMRKSLSIMLSSDPEIQVVDSARDGDEAIKKIKSLDPDVVTLDIEMPVMNGLDALKVIMKDHPVPVLMVSSLTEEGATYTLEALEIGALDYIPKNLTGVVTNIVKIRDELVSKVKIIAKKKGRLKRYNPGGKALPPLTLGRRSISQRITFVAIGASTGGPKVLTEIIPLLPKDFPAGILIAQHMPKTFTKTFAERLNQLSQLEVKEAEKGETIRPGVVLISPGGTHTELIRRKSTEVEVGFSDSHPELLYVPSVDLMMLSAASIYSDRVLGVILTGMGHDGREGMRAIKKGGGKTIAQDEESCVIFGMPKAAIEIGVIDKVASMSNIAGEIINMV